MKALVATGLLLVAGLARPQNSPDWPDWAYGQLEPLTSDSLTAPPCPDGSRAIDCAFIGPPVAEDGIRHSLPGTDRTFTRNEAYENYGPADWYPQDHPPMPDVVAHGKEDAGSRACSLCHYPNGQGKMENGHVAGLPEQYILQQLEAFARGARHSADPRKANTNEMAMIAASLTPEERRQVARYYSSMPYRKMVRVVETAEAPAVRTTRNGLLLPLEGEAPVALGNRIIEVPEYPERTEVNRDPRAGWIVYAPVGSLATGRKLADTGGGKTIPCKFCHAAGLTGMAEFPGIAGKTASYVMRQLWDIKQGTRESPVMQVVVENLSVAELTALSAYVASLDPAGSPD